MNWKCLLGVHKFSKYMGPENYGDGKFRQNYICSGCRKIKSVVS